MWNLKNMVQTNLQNGLTEIDSKSMVSGEGRSEERRVGKEC